MTSEAFWFRIEGGKTLQATGALSSSQLGCWLLLRIHLLSADHLPRRKVELQRICRGAPWQDVVAALQQFELGAAGRYDTEIKELKCKIEMISARRALAGKAGAKKRWENP